MTEINNNNVANQQAEQAKKNSKENQTLKSIVSSSRYTKRGTVENIKNDSSSFAIKTNGGFVSRFSKSRPGSVSNRYTKNFDRNKDGVISDQEVFEHIAKSRKFGSLRGFSSLLKSNENARDIYDSFVALDSKKDGRITDSELAKFTLGNRGTGNNIPTNIKSLFLQNTNLAPIEESVSNIDTDSNGLISNEELINSLLDINKNNSEDSSIARTVLQQSASFSNLEALVNRVDSEADGVISKSEIESVLADIQVGNFNTEEIKSLEAIMSRNDNFADIKETFLANNSQKTKAAAFISEKYQESLMGSYNNGTVDENPSLFTVLYDLAETLGTDFSDVDIDPSSHQFSGLVGEIQDSFEAAGYSAADFLGKAVDSLELGFIAEQLPETELDKAKDQQVKSLIENIIENPLGKTIFIGDKEVKASFLYSEVFQEIAKVYGDELIDGENGLYLGKTGAIQKGLLEHYSVEPIGDTTINKFALQRLKNNINQAIEGDAFDYAKINIKDAVDAKSKIEELQVKQNLSILNGAFDEIGDKAIKDLQQKYFPNTFVDFSDKNINLHEDLSKWMQEMTRDLTEGADVQFKTKDEWKDLLEFIYDDPRIAESLLAGVSDTLTIKDTRVIGSKLNNLIRKISEDKNLLTTEAMMRNNLDELKANGNFDFLEGIVENDANDMLNAIIFSRSKTLKNADQVFLGLNLDLNANQKEEVLAKVHAASLAVGETPVSSVLKYLTGQEDLTLAVNEDSQKVNQDLEALFFLETKFEQAALGGTEAFADNWAPEHSAMTMLEEISNIYNLSYTSSDIEELIDNPQNVDEDIIGKIIKTFNDAGQVEKLSGRPNGQDWAYPVTQSEINILQNILKDSSNVDLSFNLHDSEHNQAQNLVKDLKTSYLAGNDEVLNLTLNDILKDLAEVYGEEFLEGFPNEVEITTPESFVESIMKGAYDFGISAPVDKSPKVSFEFLDTLDNFYKNLNDDIEIPTNELFNMKEKRTTLSLLNNRLIEVSLRGIDNFPEGEKPMWGHIFEEINSIYNADATKDHAFVADLKEYYSTLAGAKNDLNDAELTPETLVKLIEYTNDLKNTDGEIVAELDKDISSYRVSIENSTIHQLKQIQANLMKVKSQLPNGDVTAFGLMDQIANVFGDVGNAHEGDFEGLTESLYSGLVAKGLLDTKQNKPVSREMVDSIDATLQNYLNSIDSLEAYTVINIEDDPGFKVIEPDYSDLKAMPMKTDQDMANYIQALKDNKEKFDTGTDQDIFHPATWLSYLNGSANEQTKKIFESGVMDINRDGQIDSIDYFAAMKANNNRDFEKSDFTHLITVGSRKADGYVDFFKTSRRENSASVDRYINAIHAQALNLSLYGGVTVNNMDANEPRELDELIKTGNTNNLRAKQAYEAGLYDFNNDGVTDAKDVEILNRYVKGNKDFDDLLANSNLPQAKTDFYSIPTNGLSKNWSNGLDEVWLKGKDDKWYYAVSKNGLTEVYPWDNSMSKQDTIEAASNNNPVASFKKSLYNNLASNSNIAE